jgi:hypothetical protein
MNKYVVLYSRTPGFGPINAEAALRRGIDRMGYDYVAIVDARDKEELFRQMNHVDGTALVARMKGTRSMSSGDVVVELTPGGQVTTWMCCSIGWAEVAVER